jgi:hypothetical protein
VRPSGYIPNRDTIIFAPVSRVLYEVTGNLGYIWGKCWRGVEDKTRQTHLFLRHGNKQHLCIGGISEGFKLE